MKYFVNITRWSEEKKAQVKEIAGTFEKVHHAIIFQKAYNKEFNASAEVVEAARMINGRA